MAVAWTFACNGSDPRRMCWANCQHPGIPPVFDQGRLPGGRAFIAMKLIEGKTLAELLEQRVSPRSDLMHFLGVFKQICETVAFAHARGVIHRDLKPGNIMVGAFGEVQVMDWGLAKRLQSQFPAPSDSSSAGAGCADESGTYPTPDASDGSTPQPGPPRTFAGAVIGTPAYMPPEQTGLGPHPIDERADVFSLGAILCEILTGQPPYTGADSNETFEQARAAALDPAAQTAGGLWGRRGPGRSRQALPVPGSRRSNRVRASDRGGARSRFRIASGAVAQCRTGPRPAGTAATAPTAANSACGRGLVVRHDIYRRLGARRPTKPASPQRCREIRSISGAR